MFYVTIGVLISIVCLPIRGGAGLSMFAFGALVTAYGFWRTMQ